MDKYTRVKYEISGILGLETRSLVGIATEMSSYQMGIAKEGKVIVSNRALGFSEATGIGLNRARFDSSKNIDRCRYVHAVTSVDPYQDTWNHRSPAEPVRFTDSEASKRGV